VDANFVIDAATLKTNVENENKSSSALNADREVDTENSYKYQVTRIDSNIHFFPRPEPISSKM